MITQLQDFQLCSGFQLCACSAQTFVPLPSKLSWLTHESPLPTLACSPREVTDKSH